MGNAGISLDRAGRLSIDKAAFTKAVSERLNDVRTLFADRGAAFETSIGDYTATGVGTVDKRLTAIDGQSSALGARIADVDSRLEKKRAALLAQFSKFEATLGRLKSIGDSLGSQLSGLNKSKE